MKVSTKEWIGELPLFHYYEGIDQLSFDWGGLATIGALAIMIPLLTFFLYVVLTVFPLYVYSEGECLERGYPGAKVTWDLDVYCISKYSDLGDMRRKVVPLDSIGG